MAAEDYFPEGAYRDPDAPFNEKEIPEREFDVDVVVTLSKKATVTTNKYDLEYDEFEGETVNTQNVDWQDVYTDNHYTLPKLLEELAAVVYTDMQKEKPYSYRWYKLKRLLDDCSGWNVEESSYDEA